MKNPKLDAFLGSVTPEMPVMEDVSIADIEFEECDLYDPDEVENTKASSTRAKTLLREMGIDKDIEWCIDGVRKAKSKFEVEQYKSKMDVYLKAVQVYKTAADTAKKNSALSSADGTNFDEVKVTLMR